MLWFDRKGQQIGVALNPGIYGNIMLAPNGKAVASDTTDPASQNTDIWTYDLETRECETADVRSRVGLTADLESGWKSNGFCVES